MVESGFMWFYVLKVVLHIKSGHGCMWLKVILCGFMWLKVVLWGVVCG